MTGRDTKDLAGHPLLPVEEALRRIEAEVAALGTETVGFEETLGRVLAEPITAAEEMPAVDRSAMDGYALRAADVAAPPVELPVKAFLPAGRSASGIEVGAGEAVRIMTGAPVPRGADAVQPVERTEDLAEGRRVRILASIAPGENIFRRGEDFGRGERLLREGTLIRPSEVGLLAAAGRTAVRVRRRPRVRVLSTGDEIVDPAETPLSHQVRNSNGPAVRAALRALGLEAEWLGIARDETEDLAGKIEAGLVGDLLILIGGVSVGDRDLVAQRMASAGVRGIFHKVAIKPGKPLLFGRREGCLVFGLPGNPVSSLTDFLVFVLPALRALSGLPFSGLLELRARLTEPLIQKPGRAWYRLARASVRGGRIEATPVRSSGSADLLSASRANAFVIMPANAARLQAGEDVRAALWPGFDGH